MPPGEGHGSSATPVTLLGALCDVDAELPEDSGAAAFTVAEFLQLADGRRVILHEDRGFTLGWGSTHSQAPAVQQTLTREALTQFVLNAVLPDDDDREAHPWQWLCALAAERGVEVSPDELRNAEYRVEMTDAVDRLLWRS